MKSKIEAVLVFIFHSPSSVLYRSSNSLSLFLFSMASFTFLDYSFLLRCLFVCLKIGG